MKRFPAYIQLSDRAVPIIGGGDEAAAKARLVAAAGARPIFIWPVLSADLRRDWAGQADFCHRYPEIGDFFAGLPTFIACEADGSRWARMARIAGALVNVVDQPDECDFTTPSIIDRGHVGVAVTTNGAAPVLGQQIREQVESLLPERIDELALFAQQYRPAVAANIAKEDRRSFWREIFNGPVGAQVLAGDAAGAHEAMLARLNCPSSNDNETGVVHIVGAGPGDPELLTMKAFRLIQNADVLVYDRLVSDDVLSLARRDAERVYVGKAKANHSRSQTEIEQILVDHARDGKIVVRLKGGDPFIFGRGGEELQTVRDAGIPVYVTPGVTAALGCAASAGMALTHRDCAQAVTFVTGHASGDQDPDLDWASLAALGNTLVIYMGVTKAEIIAERLISHGRDHTTPVAIIENGSCANQIIVKGTLNGLAALVDNNKIIGPAILVVGEVAALASESALRNITDAHNRSAA